MLNTRQGNNRRRSRNNNNNQRPQNNGQGRDNSSRIDNRARGNAPQLLEKYRNMARDSQLAGDRVMTEYYNQFADHYFRVVSEMRARQEEQQARRNRDDWDNGDRESDQDNQTNGNAEPYGADQDNDDLDDGYAHEAPMHHNTQRTDSEESKEEESDDRSFERRLNATRRAEQAERPQRSFREARAPRAAQSAQYEAPPLTLPLDVLPPAIASRLDDESHDEDAAQEEVAPKRRGRPRKVADAIVDA